MQIVVHRTGATGDQLALNVDGEVLRLGTPSFKVKLCPGRSAHLVAPPHAFAVDSAPPAPNPCLVVVITKKKKKKKKEKSKQK